MNKIPFLDSFRENCENFVRIKIMLDRKVLSHTSWMLRYTFRKDTQKILKLINNKKKKRNNCLLYKKSVVVEDKVTYFFLTKTI